MTTQSRRRRQFQLYFTLARSARNYYGNFLLCVCSLHHLMSLTPQSSVREFRKGEREVDDDAEASEAQHRWSRHPHSSAHVCIPAPLLQSWRSVRRHNERARDFSPKSRRRKHSRHISRYTHFKFRDFTSHKLSKSSKTPSNQFLGVQTKNWLDGV